MQRWLFLVVAACGGGTPATSAPTTTAPTTTAPASPPADHSAPLGHRFENAERWAKVFDDPARDRWQRPDRVVALVEARRGMTVVDLGAGTGYFEKRLSEAVGDNGKVLAVDVEPDMVRYLAERAQRERTPNVEARLAAVADPRIAQVDRILIVDTWHHIPDRVEYSKKLKAALKLGGFILVIDFTLDSERGPPRAHRLSPEQVIAELQRAGLVTSVVAEDLPDQYVIKGER